MEKINKLLDSIQKEIDYQYKARAEEEDLIHKIVHREITRSLGRIMKGAEN